MTHGLYSKALTATEAAQWDAVPIGDVDHEIRMCKVWLARALELDHAISQDPGSLSNKAGMTIAEIRRSVGGGDASADVVSRRPDTIVRINVLLGRIAQLEKTRAELMAAAAERGDGVDEKARNVASVLRAMIEVETTPVDAPDDDAE